MLCALQEQKEEYQTEESERIRELESYRILDTEAEEAFDRITRLVKATLKFPIVLVSLVDANRQWFKSRQGLEALETSRDISFCTHAIQKNEPFVVENALTDPRFCDNPLVKDSPYIRSYFGIPLTTPEGYNIGTLCAIDQEPRSLPDEQVSMLQDYASMAMTELKLRKLSYTDPATGVQNRRSFIAQLTRKIELSAQSDSSFSLITFDIDDLKSVNQAHGHPVGDRVIRNTALLCREFFRDADSFARIGGEEFAVILDGTELMNAVATAKRLCTAIASNKTLLDDGFLNVTASLGVAQYALGDDHASLLQRADEARFEAKANERNCVRFRISRMENTTPENSPEAVRA